jgi:hypothetical protein
MHHVGLRYAEYVAASIGVTAMAFSKSKEWEGFGILTSSEFINWSI